MKKKKIRVNITVDKEILERAKTKLKFFGGKLSTLFNVYLSDFVEGIGKTPSESQEEIKRAVKELDLRLRKIEGKIFRGEGL